MTNGTIVLSDFRNYIRFSTCTIGPAFAFDPIIDHMTRYTSYTRYPYTPVHVFRDDFL